MLMAEDLSFKLMFSTFQILNTAFEFVIVTEPSFLAVVFYLFWDVFGGNALDILFA